MSTKIEGLPELLLELIGKALFEEALEILEEAKRRVPVLTGALRDSGKVAGPFVEGKEVSVVISFGDETVTWAIPVHERTYVKHMTGRSKYLESVILEQSSAVLQRIADKVSSFRL